MRQSGAVDTAYNSLSWTKHSARILPSKVLQILENYLCSNNELRDARADWNK